MGDIIFQQWRTFIFSPSVSTGKYNRHPLERVVPKDPTLVPRIFPIISGASC